MELFGAIDVGSNSVRLQVAAFISGFQHQVVREERAVTRLGESVFQTGELSERSMKHTIAVLKEFRARAEADSVVALRAVGTSALRDAGNAGRFLAAARRECGLDIDIISGREEARLIHLGVISRLAGPGDPVLVIDVGGGSAEFILGADRRLRACSSAPLGAVRLTELFLESDPPSAPELERLESYVRKKLQRVKTVVRGVRPDDAEVAGRRNGALKVIGCSGTMAALAQAINGVALPRAELEGEKFRVQQVEAYYRGIRPLSLAERRATIGLGTRRAEIIIAGAAVVALAMRELEIERVVYSDAGLRDGVLVELAARRKGDAAGIQYLNAERLESVHALAEHYGYAPSHSEQVLNLARQLFHLLQPLHGLAQPYGELLEAGAILHDIGAYVNVSKPHKHSFYLVANSELPGYTNRERLLIAVISRYQRGAHPTSEHEGFRKLPAPQQDAVVKLAALLRLADACDNGRRGVVQSLLATARSDRVDLTLLTSGPAELEAWAVRKASAFFRKAFGKKLEVEVRTMKPVTTP